MLKSPKRAASVLISTLLLAGVVSGCKTSNFSSQPDARLPKSKVAPVPTVPPAAVPAATINPITTETLEADPYNPIFDSTLDSETWTLNAPEPPAPPEPPKPVVPPVVVPPQVLTPPKPPEPKFNDERETFTQQGVTGKADIIIVVDNSNSMREEQKNLSDKLRFLIGSLRDADWQIGVVTTTVKSDKNGDKCDMTLIKRDEQDIDNRFAKAVQPGISGDVNEQGIRAAVAGLRCQGRSWVRDNSTVAVLMLSDEDNCSNGKGCNNHAAKSEQFLIDYIERDIHRTVGMNAGFYGIFSPPGEKCKTAGNTANIYQRLVNYRSMGQKNYGNICDASYQGTLEQISKNIAKLLTSQFRLRQKPYPGSLSISGRKSNGDEIRSGDYNLNEEVVSFNPGNEPALGSEIVVTYKIKVN